MENDRQLFVLGPDIWRSIKREDVISTHEALLKCRLFHPPFEEFDIKIIADFGDITRFHRDSHDKTFPQNYTIHEHFRYITREASHPAKSEDEAPFEYQYFYKKGDRFFHPDEIYRDSISTGFSKTDADRVVSAANIIAESYLCALIVLLSTKNVIKTTEQVKRHGAKSKKRPREYKYITTIKVGKITETMHGDGEGRGPVRPHLRRGHIRNQRIGEGRKETKQVFIQPVFVNADEKWIENQRQEYRVKL